MNDTMVLDDFVLIDGTGRLAVPERRVVVEGGVIASVGLAVRRASGPEVIQGRGRWLIPGLWDTHIHHGFSAGGFVRSEEFSQQQRLWNWLAYLRSGVTSVVSVGDDKSAILAARGAERAGNLVAPRIFAAGPVFTAPGGHPVATILHGELARSGGELALEVRNPADGRRELRRLVEHDDVDIVKVIYSTIPGNVPRLGRDVLDALVEEAHALGRPAFGHVSTTEEAAHCIAAGVDGLEHMVLDDADALAGVFAAAANRGVVWTATLCLFDKMAHDGDPRYVEDYHPEGFVSATVLRSLQDQEAWWHKPEEGAITPPWSRTVELAGRAHAAGVRLALGTDAGNPAVFHGLAVHRELELFVRAGIAPMDALLSATAHAAAKVGASDTIGTIEPGKEADLVALTGNPLEDVRNTRALDLVIKRGKLFDRGVLTVPL